MDMHCTKEHIYITCNKINHIENCVLPVILLYCFADMILNITFLQLNIIISSFFQNYISLVQILTAACQKQEKENRRRNTRSNVAAAERERWDLRNWFWRLPGKYK